VAGGPELGRAVFGAGRQHGVAARRQAQADQVGRQGDGVYLQAGLVGGGVGLTAEGRVKRHHGRAIGLGRVFQAVRQQADARLAQVTHAFGDAGQERQQRAFERIGADVGRRKAAAELARQAAPGLELQTAVGKRKFDHPGHLRHQPVHRRHPGQRANGEPFAARVQPAQQRFGHHCVPDPLGRDDQGLSGGR
jgi:hypothetical protein